MHIKIFKHGKGRGELATDYLVKEDYANRHTPPSVLRGDHKLTTDLINSLDTVWKYTSGVISWHPDDKVSPEKEVELMNDFEKLAFAGLEPDQYNILWVRHSHAGHHELHFVIPRVELTTGKSFNPFPPKGKFAFDPLRDIYNIKESWARPDDPKRARLYTPEHADIKYNRLKRQGKEIVQTETDKIREFLLNYTVKRIESGLVKDRTDILKDFEELGFKINRQGKTYISVQDTENKHKIRFKGGIFHEHWRFTEEGAREARGGHIQTRKKFTEDPDKLRAELDEIHRKRARSNRERYSRHSKAYKHYRESEQENSFFQPLHGNTFSDGADFGLLFRKQSDWRLHDKRNQRIEDGDGSSRDTNGDSTNNASEFANMGNNHPHGREWEFLTPPSWDNNQYKLGNHYEEWEQEREFQSNQAREEINHQHNKNFRKNTGNNSKIELNTSINQQTKEIYERDTRISTEILHPFRTGTFDDTETTLPSHTTTNNTNTKYQERAEQFANAMQVTKRGIAKLEQGIHELRTLIERFKEYIGEKVRQDTNKEQEKETTQETQSTPTTTQAPAPRRWRM